MLEKLNEMVLKMNTTNSSTEKKEILKGYSEIKELLQIIYSPYKQFHVTSANLQKHPELIEVVEGLRIIDLLNRLSFQEISGHQAIAEVNGFIQRFPKFQSLIFKIIDKNLEIRLDSKSINKTWPGLIPEFDVALAKKFSDQEAKIDFQRDRWAASQKLDGVRCIVRKEGLEIKLFSRNGKEFLTLDKLKEAIISHFGSETFLVLDGEICLVDENGNENFQDVMKEIRKKDHTISHPLYNVFDLLTLKEFDSKKSTTSFFQRFQSLTKYFKKENSPFIKLVDQTVIENSDHLTTLFNEAVQKSWEGLILRKDVTYQGKRSNDLLKMKQFFDAEYVVEGVEFGIIRYIKDGKDVGEKMLSKVDIRHKGNKVGVGSGFSISQRQEFFLNPEKILGKTITVNYFEETKDQFGKHSLRFPILKHIWDKGKKI